MNADRAVDCRHIPKTPVLPIPRILICPLGQTERFGFFTHEDRRRETSLSILSTSREIVSISVSRQPGDVAAMIS